MKKKLSFSNKIKFIKFKGENFMRIGKCNTEHILKGVKWVIKSNVIIDKLK